MKQLLLTIIMANSPLINSQPPPDDSGMGADTDTSTSTLCDIDGNDATYTEYLSGDLRVIQSNNCPNHYSECVGKGDICDVGDGITEAVVGDKNITIPATPCISNYTDSEWDGYPVYCILDSLGIAFNGVALFGPSGNDACDDAIDAEGETFDYCGGHANPDGTYHYHVAPACLLDQLGDSEDSVDGHSPQIGWAYDGFPVYGPHGLNGEYIELCSQSTSNTSDCLDTCSGHDQHEIDGFKYHYHAPGPVGDLKTNPVDPIPSTDRYPYLFGCFKGIPADWSLINLSEEPTGIACKESGVTDEYVAKAADGITEVYVSPYATSDTTTTGTGSPESAVYGLFNRNCLILVSSLLITIVAFQ